MTIAASLLAHTSTRVGSQVSIASTWQLTYPEFIHNEVLTHKILSRSSASSRAIPTAKLLETLRTHPVLPVEWGLNQAGMQAGDLLSEEMQREAERIWIRGCAWAVRTSEDLNAIGVHKQLANRPLQPYKWMTTILTGTEWSNFYALRTHKDAQPEFRALATRMLEHLEGRPANDLDDLAWHRPLVPDVDQLISEGYDDQTINLIAAGRCARVSYLTHDGLRHPQADIDLSARLMTSGHWSPFEHVLQALGTTYWPGYAADMARGWIEDRIPVGNVWGYRQLRKTMKNEHDFSIDHPIARAG